MKMKQYKQRNCGMSRFSFRPSCYWVYFYFREKTEAAHQIESDSKWTHEKLEQVRSVKLIMQSRNSKQQQHHMPIENGKSCQGDNSTEESALIDFQKNWKQPIFITKSSHTVTMRKCYIELQSRRVATKNNWPKRRSNKTGSCFAPSHFGTDAFSKKWSFCIKVLCFFIILSIFFLIQNFSDF